MGISHPGARGAKRTSGYSLVFLCIVWRLGAQSLAWRWRGCDGAQVSHGYSVGAGAAVEPEGSIVPPTVERPDVEFEQARRGADLGQVGWKAIGHWVFLCIDRCVYGVWLCMIFPYFFLIRVYREKIQENGTSSYIHTQS